jgi:predicted RNA-binding Zn-ribbon protein involved in translation (DUF1610 family)
MFSVRNPYLQARDFSGMQRPVAHTFRKPVVVGTRDEAIRLCGICLGEIKGGLPFAICDCGKLYHVTCGFRVGVCVSCGIQMHERMRREPDGWASQPRQTESPSSSAQETAGQEEDASVESVEEPGVAPIAPPLPPARRLSTAQKLELLEERLLTGHISEALYTELKSKFEAERQAAPIAEPQEPEDESISADAAESYACPECGQELDDGAPSCPRCGIRFGEGFECPECGAALDKDQRRCACGAEFTDVEIEYSCPMCGAVQSGDSERCAACGAVFEGEAHETEYECPECGRTVDELAARCECGAVFDREEHQGTALQCPECHAEVSREDAFCPGCGARFEEG